MSRTSGIVVVVALAAALAGLAVGRRAAAEGPSKNRIVYVYVTGTGAQAKAWYDGAPPAGVQVQSALDRFTVDGFKFAAISSSGRTQLAGTASGVRSTDEVSADYVILLER